MRRRRRGEDLKMEGTSHIIQTAPSTKPPQGDNPIYSEAVHWYWSADGKWTADRKKAHHFARPSDAVAKIRELRIAIDFVEFTLEPVHGTGSMYRPY